MDDVKGPRVQQRQLPVDHRMMCWFYAWVGTMTAGALFGLIAGEILGLFFGSLIAGVVGVPVLATFAILTWALWLTRYTIATSAIAGGCTGCIATEIAWGPIFSIGYVSSVILATAIGTFVTATFSGFYWFNAARANEGESCTANAWQYSLRGLFLRFSVVTVLIAAWSLVIGKAFLNQ
jgi:hypothetical protein